MKEKDAASVGELEEKLARGKRFKEELTNRLANLFKTYRDALGQNDLVDLIAGLDGAQLVVGQVEFQKVKDLVNGYSATVKKLAGSTDYDRIRVSDYRVLYEVRDRDVLVLVIKIGHSREVYR